MKRTLSALLILALLVGLCPAVQAQTGTADAALSRQEITVTSENDFAELLSDEINEELNAYEKNNGYHIFSLEVSGTTALVTMEALGECSLVVGIYDEAGTTLLASGSRQVCAADKSVTVEIETEEMPQYFLVKAYLLDTVNKNPLCTAYQNPNYTQEMQEFLAKTVEDFDSDLVVNLDEDPTTNFAVYKEGVIQVIETETAHRRTERIDSLRAYTFDDCEDALKNLKNGDVLAYTTLEGELLIICLNGNPYVNGNRVTLSAVDTSLEEVFDYVKIDAASGLTEDGYDDAYCDDGVEFAGFEYTAGTNDTNVGGSQEVSVKLNLGEASTNPGKLTGKISGSVTLKVKATFSLYITENYRSMTILLNYGATLNAKMSVKAELLKIKLGQFTICPAAGLYIRLTPSLVAEASGSLTLKGELTGTIGFTANTATGMQDLTSTPSFDGELDAEFTVFVGISMEPEVGFVSQYLAKASIDATAGVELSASFCDTTPDESYVHDCQRCLDGDVKVKISISFEAKFLSNPLWTYNLDIVDLEWKAGDFYWSVTYGEFAFTTCPHLTRKIDVTVYDRLGEPAVYATVEFVSRYRQYASTTDEKGQAAMYITDGTYTVTAELNNTFSATQTIPVDGDVTELVLYLTEDKYDPEKAYAVKAIERGGNTAAAITESGDLYVWGSNENGKAGIGLDEKYAKTPVKIMEDVAKVSLGEGHGAAITESGDLYVWGRNSLGRLGNLAALDIYDKYIYSPLKVLSGVRDVAADNLNTAVVMDNGDLCIWGKGYYTGIGSNADCEVVLQNVRSVNMESEIVAAITEDGELYVWGNNINGNLADGTMEDSLEPRKVMDDVVMADISHAMCAVTSDGSLYAWGHLKDLKMSVSTNIEDHVTTPTLLMNNVVKVSGGGGYTTCILTSDGLLYAWGDSTLGVTDAEKSQGQAIITTPMPVLSGIADVCVEEDTFTVILESGEMQVWGSNNFYQQGLGVLGTIEYPTTLNLNREETEDGGGDTENPTALSPQSIEGRPVVYDGKQQVTFSGLDPEALYQFYVLMDRDAAEPFTPDNLLYTDQVRCDEWGNLELIYMPTEICSYADVFLEEFVDITAPEETPLVNPFTDVPADSFYYAPVLWAVEKGITTGATETTFNPGGDCLRAQVVTFLWRAEGCPEPESTDNPFTDVTESDWYYKAVLWAVENGITNGTSDTTFGPTAKCNRAQTVTFLWRAMGQPAVSSTDNPFSDVPANVWYTAPILWAVEEGITNGMGDGTFGVNGICNRAQVVTFLYRAYN